MNDKFYSDLADRHASLVTELDQAKADRNKAAAAVRAELLPKLAKLAKENERLRAWIRSEGDRAGVCTYAVLGEKCDGCGCERKETA